jgi:hypothetical protein
MTTNTGPIFILGAPRSGNTLIGCLLNKHPACFILFERSIFSDTYRKWCRLTTRGAVSGRDAFVSLMGEGNQWAVYNERAGLDDAALRHCAEAGDGQFNRMFDAYMARVMDHEKPTATIWGDKTPMNSGYLPSILAEYPDARIINVYRDPRAVAASLTDARFTPAGDDLLINAEVARHYSRIFCEGAALIDPAAVLNVRYEDLVKDPQTGLRTICDFLGLEYADTMLEPAPDSIRQSIGWPDYKGWDKIAPQRSKLQPTLAPLVEAHLANHLRRLGYAPNAPKPTVLQRLRLTVRLLPFVSYRVLLERLWRLRYGDIAPFVLHAYPSLGMYMSWLRTSFIGAKRSGH